MKPETNGTRPAPDLAALRRFHLGAPGAPIGDVPEGALPAGLHGLRDATEGGAAPEAPVDPLALLRHTLAEARRETRETFCRKARELAAQAEALLEAERQKGAEAREPEGLGTSMGSLGSRYVSPDALSGLLAERRGGVPLPEVRIRGLEEALELLRDAAQAPPGGLARARPILVHNGTLPRLVAPIEVAADGVIDENGRPGDGFEPWTTLESSDPCAVAAGVFDRKSEEVARLLRAARRVRLEAAGEYVPERHDALLAPDTGPAGLDWQAFSRDELALVAPVVALESADQLAERGMVSLAKLLLSGRPVQVVLVADPASSPGEPVERLATEAPAEPFSGFRFEPAYLGLALREAFVQQGSVSRAADLEEGFRRAAASDRAALHVVDTAPLEVPGLAPATVAGSAVLGRAHPVFRYDPEAGPSWADRMTLGDNPAPEDDWPQAGGAPFTFADYCLLDPALAGCFLEVPEGSEEEDGLLGVPEWLQLDAEEALRRVPTVEAAGPDGRPIRLAVSRPLALACRDRLGFWRTLQELSGVRSEHVRRAEVRLREEADARIAEERERLEAAHAAELGRVRREAVEEVVDRLTAGILGIDPSWLAPATPESALGAFAGRDADGVAAELLEMVGTSDGDESTPGDGRTDSEAIDRLAGELMTLLGPSDGPDGPDGSETEAEHAPAVLEGSEGS